MTKRTTETQAKYDQARKNGETILKQDESGSVYFDWAEETIFAEYKHWVIIPNRFPYDTIFIKHDLLVPKRHFAYIREATDEERHEYYQIKKDLDLEGGYESLIENFSLTRSVGKHFHVHLVKWIE